MTELEFNHENCVKVIKAMTKGLVGECVDNLLKSKLKEEEPDQLIMGMAQTAKLFLDILTNEADFYDAIKFLSKHDVIIE